MIPIELVLAILYEIAELPLLIDTFRNIKATLPIKPLIMVTMNYDSLKSYSPYPNKQAIIRKDTPNKP
jgi:hypothetical protein